MIPRLSLSLVAKGVQELTWDNGSSVIRRNQCLALTDGTTCAACPLWSRV